MRKDLQKELIELKHQADLCQVLLIEKVEQLYSEELAYITEQRKLVNRDIKFFDDSLHWFWAMIYPEWKQHFMYRGSDIKERFEDFKLDWFSKNKI
jgi:hypothetical protein